MYKATGLKLAEKIVKIRLRVKASKVAVLPHAEVNGFFIERIIMNLKKNLKAQASLEYFIIFTVIAGLTLLSLSSFLPRARNSARNLFSNAVNRILR